MNKAININTSVTKWNLTPLLNDPSQEEAKLNELKNASYNFINKWKDRLDYLEDPAVLKEALDEYEAWAANYGTDGDVGYYYGLRSAQDQLDTEIRAKLNKINDISTQISNDIQFFEHRLSKVALDTQKQFLSYAELAPYHHFLKNLFENAKYLLSEEEEKILNLVSPTSHSHWVRMVSSMLSTVEKEVLTEEEKLEVKSFNSIFGNLSSKKKNVRDSAAQAINETLKAHLDVAENELNSVLQYKKVNDELRKVEKPDKLRHISDDIESDVVDTLVQVISSRNSISHKYYELKAKLLGLKKLAYHERSVEYGDIDKKYTYDESVELVNKTFLSLDAEFAEIFKKMVENGQFDVFPQKGKSGGAFCAGGLLNQPVYILLNHNNKINDVLTIAHEMGHAINDYLIKDKQNALNAGTSLATAEVASTFMEDFVLQELLKDADDETKLALLISKLDSDVGSIPRQIAAYRFEQELHTNFREQGYLSKQAIGDLFQKHMESYMGPYVEQTEDSKNWWVYWGHIRRFFYVYSYASGLLISKSMQYSVKQDPQFITKVKEFLSAGSSASPKEIFLQMGIDITKKDFWNKGLNEMEKQLNEAEELAVKLNKI